MTGISHGVFDRLLFKLFDELLESQGTSYIEHATVFGWAEDYKISLSNKALIEKLKKVPCLEVSEGLIRVNHSLVRDFPGDLWGFLRSLLRKQETNQVLDCIGLIEVSRLGLDWTLNTLRWCVEKGYKATPVFWREDGAPATDALGSFATATAGLVLSRAQEIRSDSSIDCMTVARKFLNSFVESSLLEGGRDDGGVSIAGAKDDDYVGCDSNARFYSGKFTCPTVNSTAQLLSALLELGEFKVSVIDRLCGFLLRSRATSIGWPVYCFEDLELIQTSAISTSLVVLARNSLCNRIEISCRSEMQQAFVDAADCTIIELIGLLSRGIATSECTLSSRKALVDLDSTAFLLIAIFDTSVNLESECRMKLFRGWFDEAISKWPKDFYDCARIRIRAPFWDRFDSGDFHWEFSRKCLWGLVIGKYLRYAARFTNSEWDCFRSSVVTASQLQKSGGWYDVPKLAEGSKQYMVQNCWIGSELINCYLTLTSMNLSEAFTRTLTACVSPE
jgi:hypothetical protein